MNVSNRSNTNVLTIDSIIVSRLQSNFFLVTFLVSVFAFPLSSYITEFLGYQSNLLSIAARGFTLLIVLAYLMLLVAHGIFRPNIFFYLFFAFWLLYGIRILYDTTTSEWQLGRTSAEYYLFAFVLSFFCTIPFFVAVKYPLKQIEKWSFLFLVILNLLGLYNNLSAENLFVERLGGNEKLNPIAFGMQAALLLVLSILRLYKGCNKYLTLFLFLTLILGIGNLFLAASKSPIIFALISILLILYKSLKKKILQTLIIIALIAGLGLIVFQFLDFSNVIFLALQRFMEIGEDTSSLERIDQLTGGYNQFIANPLAGSFLEEYVYKSYPHNLVLESFMATGILGGTLFSIFYFAAWYYTIKNIILSNLAFLPFISLSFLVMSLFSGGLSFFVDFWYCSAVMFPFFQVTSAVETPFTKSHS